MHSGRRNRVIAAVLALIMAFSLQTPVYAGVKEVPVVSEPATLSVRLSDADYKAISSAAENTSVTADYKASQVYNHKWDKYSSNYFYNHATDKQKEIWDYLDEKSIEFLNGENNYVKGTEDYLLSFFKCEGGDDISYEDLYAVVTAFKYSNPQYYFLSCVYYDLPDSTTYGGAGIGIYDRFIGAAERRQATAAFKQALDGIAAMAEDAGSDEERIKLIHDSICTRVSYLDNFNEIDEQESISQSAYSALCMDKTVCAGYTLAFEAVCNSLGINCMGVTSEWHAWNRVEINDSWVNVDLTWDDYGAEVSYDFFKISDNKINESDSEKDYSAMEMYPHTMEDGWKDKAPVCTVDSESTGAEVLKLPVPQNVTAEPEMTYKKTKKGYKIALTCKTAGASVYYTIDGTSPDPSAAKCSRYEGEFYVDDYKKVKAVAVCDTRFDSNHVITYNIVFKGNGATSGKVQPIKNAKYGTKYKLRANKFVRAGYKFAGWSLSKKGDNILKAGTKVKNLTLVNGKNVVYYARWTKK